MKKVLLLASLLAFSVLGLSAQVNVPVTFQGEKPTISDFAWAYVNYWYQNGIKKQKTLQFDGRRFSF